MTAWWAGLSIRVRLVALYTLALVVVLVPYAAGSYLFMRGALLTAMDEALHGEAEEAVLVMTEAAELAGSRAAVLHAALQRLEAVEDVRYELWSTAGELIYRGRFPQIVLRALPAIGAERRVFSIRPDDGRRYRVQEQAVRLGDRSYLFRVVSTEQPVRTTLARLFAIQTAGLIVALLLAGVGGYFLARRALSPVRLITDEARLLTTERLRDGIPVVNPHDELGRLARTFNDVFRTLDTSFVRLREFTADASHELRTPLASIRSVAEVGLARDDAGKRESLQSVLEETRRMTGILDDLLMLARAEAQQLPLERSPLDLSALCRDVIAQLAVLAEEQAQSLMLVAESPVIVLADRDTVRHALTNIVDNAIKHGLDGRPITITTRCDAAHGVITVADRGPGIDAADRERVFERFFRADGARARATGGTGLGLAIALWAVKANGGTIELDSSVETGSTFRIRLPLASRVGPGQP